MLPSFAIISLARVFLSKNLTLYFAMIQNTKTIIYSINNRFELLPLLIFSRIVLLQSISFGE